MDQSQLQKIDFLSEKLRSLELSLYNICVNSNYNQSKKCFLGWSTPTVDTVSEPYDKSVITQNNFNTAVSSYEKQINNISKYSECIEEHKSTEYCDAKFGSRSNIRGKQIRNMTLDELKKLSKSDGFKFCTIEKIELGYEVRHHYVEKN